MLLFFLRPFYVDSNPFLIDFGVPVDKLIESWNVFLRYFWGNFVEDFFKWDFIPKDIGDVLDKDFPITYAPYLRNGVLSSDAGMS